MLLHVVMSILYNIWLMFIYIVAMTLSTFWVQDIFDELIQIKLARLIGNGQKVKEPAKVLQKM